MADRFGINYGDVVARQENIKGAKTTNALNSLRLKGAEREEAERPARMERQKNMNVLRGKAITGDEEAEAILLSLDPVGGLKFLESVAKMDERKIKQAKDRNEEVGRAAAYIMQGEGIDEQTRRYTTLRAGMDPEMQKTLPEGYDPNFMELQMSKAMTMAQILENPKAVTVGDTDILYKGGKKLREGKRPKKSTGGGMKAGDESFMYKQTVELLGGLFDEMGNITALDPDVRGKVQAISTEASNILQSTPGLSRAEAVKRAATKFKIKIPEAGQGEGDLDQWLDQQ